MSLPARFRLPFRFHARLAAYCVALLLIGTGFALHHVQSAAQENPATTTTTAAASDTVAAADSSNDASAGDSNVEVLADGTIKTKINWVAKMKEGGTTMIALLILSIAGVVFMLERCLLLRSKYYACPKLADNLDSALRQQDYDQAMLLCNQSECTLARVGTFVLEHRHNDVDTISVSASDIAARDIRNATARTYPLAVVASLSPLLGLLGTMIGMIEAFELVHIYGDDGGASMLAGAIAKALITTAVGLIIAIPAISAYHFFKLRINHLTNALEMETESMLHILYLKQHPEHNAEVTAAATTTETTESTSA